MDSFFKFCQKQNWRVRNSIYHHQAHVTTAANCCQDRKKDSETYHSNFAAQWKQPPDILGMARYKPAVKNYG
jgi:hypothetical protein